MSCNWFVYCIQLHWYLVIKVKTTINQHIFQHFKPLQTLQHLFNIEMNECIAKIYICICVETTTILKHYLKTTLTPTKWKEEKTLLEIWFCISNYFPSYNYYSSFSFAFATQLQFTINTNTQTQTQTTTHPHNRIKKMFSLRQRC